MKALGTGPQAKARVRAEMWRVVNRWWGAKRVMMGLWSGARMRRCLGKYGWGRKLGVDTG